MDPRGMLRLPEDDKENTRLGLSNSLRASTKVRAAAIDAVKLATACTIQGFSKTSENEGNNKDLGKIKRNVHKRT